MKPAKWRTATHGRSNYSNRAVSHMGHVRALRACEVANDVQFNGPSSRDGRRDRFFASSNIAPRLTSRIGYSRARLKTRHCNKMVMSAQNLRHCGVQKKEFKSRSRNKSYHPCLRFCFTQPILQATCFII